jgi:hypothetical protein
VIVTVLCPGVRKRGWLAQHLYALGYEPRCHLERAWLHQQDELIAGQASHRVTTPHHRLQSSGNRLQQLIAVGMAEAVVNLLESSRSMNNAAAGPEWAAKLHINICSCAKTPHPAS